MATNADYWKWRQYVFPRCRTELPRLNQGRAPIRGNTVRNNSVGRLTELGAAQQIWRSSCDWSVSPWIFPRPSPTAAPCSHDFLLWPVSQSQSYQKLLTNQGSEPSIYCNGNTDHAIDLTDYMLTMWKLLPSTYQQLVLVKCKTFRHVRLSQPIIYRPHTGRLYWPDQLVHYYLL